MPGRVVEAEPNRWKAASKLVAARRERLEITQQQAVAASNGDISLAVWSILENAQQKGGRMTAKALRGASVALGWEPDYLERFVKSKDVDLDGSAESQARMRELRDEIRAADEPVVAWVNIPTDVRLDDLTVEYVQDFARLIMGVDEVGPDELRRLGESIQSMADRMRDGHSRFRLTAADRKAEDDYATAAQSGNDELEEIDPTEGSRTKPRG